MGIPSSIYQGKRRRGRGKSRERRRSNERKCKWGGTDAAVDVGVEWRNPTPWPTVGWPTGERCSFLSCPWETIAVRLLFKTIVVIYYYEWDPWISLFQPLWNVFFIKVSRGRKLRFDTIRKLESTFCQRWKLLFL